MSVARLADDLVLLITAATAQAHDRDWLQGHLDAGLSLSDVTDAWSTQILTGPKSREILAAVCDADLSKGWLSHQFAQLAGAEVWLARVSFAGELGWEIHSKLADTAKVWDAVLAAGAPLGLKPFLSLIHIYHIGNIADGIEMQIRVWFRGEHHREIQCPGQ